jgi:hypothetical protein
MNLNLQSSDSTCCLTACRRGLFGREFIGVIKYFYLFVENTVQQNDLIIKANVICIKLLRVSTRAGHQHAYEMCYGMLVVYFVYILCKPDDDPIGSKQEDKKNESTCLCISVVGVETRQWARRSGVPISKTFRPI